MWSTTNQVAHSMVILSFWAAFYFTVSSARQVEVDIQANWPKYTTNIITEVGEYLYDQTDISLQADESVSAANNKLYWNFASKMCSHSSVIDQILESSATGSLVSDEVETDLYSATYNVAQGSLPSGLHSLVQHMISVGEYTPTVRFYQLLSQQYDATNPCSSNVFGVILPHREFICSAETIRATLQNLQTQDTSTGYVGQKEYVELFDSTWDHQYRPMSAKALSDDNHLPYLVLYGTLGSSSLCAFLSEATALVDQKHIEGFSLRSSFHSMVPVASTSPLQGYGVYLDIKNMEYHNFDDEDNAKKDNSPLSSTEELAKLNPDEEILGINVYTLSKHFEKHKDDYPISHFTTLRRQLLFANSTNKQDGNTEATSTSTNTAAGSTEMKIWKLKDLGLQLVQSFHTLFGAAQVEIQRNVQQTEETTNQPYREAIEKVTEYIWNFPVFASMLSTAKVSSALRDELNAFHTMTPLGNLLPTNTLFLRGKPIRLDSNTFNYFDILQKLHNEYKHLLQVTTWFSSSTTAATTSAWDRLQLPSQFAEIVEHVAAYEELPGGKGLYYVHSPSIPMDSSSTGDVSATNEQWEDEWQLHASESDEYSFEKATEAANPWASITSGGRGSGMDGSGGSPASEVSYRVDISKGSKHAVIFVNNLEKDVSYRGWSKSLQALFYPSWSLPQLRRNLYTIVTVVDFFSKEGIFMHSQVQMMLQQMYPIRFGFVPVCSSSASAAAGTAGTWSVDGLATPELFCFLFATLKEEQSSLMALEFVNTWSEHYMQYTHPHFTADADAETLAIGREYKKGKIPVEQLLEVYESTLKRNRIKLSYTKRELFLLKIQEFFRVQTMPTGDTTTSTHEVAVVNGNGNVKWQNAYYYITNTTTYLSQRGLPINSFSLNGQIVQETSFQTQSFMSMLGAEQQLYQQLVQTGKILDTSKSLFVDLLAEGQKEGLFVVYTKFHRLLQDEKSGTGKRYVRYLPTIDTNTDQMSGGTKMIETLTEEGHWIVPSIKALYVDEEIAGRSKYQSSEEVKVGHTLLIALPWFSTTGQSQSIKKESVATAQKVLHFVLDNNQQQGDRAIRVGFLPTVLPVPSDEMTTQTCSTTDDATTDGGVCVQDTFEDIKVALLLHFFPSYFQQFTPPGVCNYECIRILEQLYADLLSETSENKMTIAQLIHTIQAYPIAQEVAIQFQALFDTPDTLQHVMIKYTSFAQSLITGKVVVPTTDDNTFTVIFNGRSVQLENIPEEIPSDLSLLRDLEVKSHAKFLHGLMVLIDSLPTKLVHDEATVATADAGSLSSVKNALDIYTSKSNLLLSLLSYVHHHEELVGGGKDGSSSSSSSSSKLSFHKIWKATEDTLGHAFPSLRYFLSPHTMSTPSNTKSTWQSGAMEIVFLVDPLSLGGQRAMKLMDIFLHSLHFPITVLFLPKESYTEFPLKTFYRYVLPSTSAVAAVADNEVHTATENEGAFFEDLPRQHVLTTRLDVPEMWNVQHYRAYQDSDNLRCSRHACGDPLPTTTTTYSSTTNESTESTPKTSQHTKIDFILKNVLVAGQCFQATEEELMTSLMTPTMNTRPQYMYNPVPNGLQVVLTPQLHTPNQTISSSSSSDTIVMQNLGYYQLLAEIGIYELGLVEDSRSQSLYHLYAGNPDEESSSSSFSSSSLSSSLFTSEKKSIVIKHFHDEIRTLVVVKRTGYEAYQLLDDTPLPNMDGTTTLTLPTTSSSSKEEGEFSPKKRGSRGGAAGKGSKKSTKDSTASSGIWNTITSTLFGSGAGSSSSTSEKGIQRVYGEDDKIHVFSLATGQLYERLLRIMMVSVTKHTSRPVKFWLFENYLSSHFKQIVAIMTQIYGFEVAYVTYKWPQWLIPQTQQQRIIWGYKILFLDVLFPQTLKRVIYIDADQVIRHDLLDLWTLDLQGAAYAYPPFCTSRKEMLGFQFWTTGYWKDHLQDKSYHISALYVVDLLTFRQHSVGDQLRAIYNQLARDPNSLANLDQDLPNYAQWQIPIYTLPVEWLWCETWCSSESKPKARTIDLCNNPLNKEPKLDMARRIISGELFDQSWIDLDEEIKAVITQHSGNLTSSSSA